MATFRQTLCSPEPRWVASRCSWAGLTTRAVWRQERSTRPTDVCTSPMEAPRTAPYSTRFWSQPRPLFVGWAGRLARECHRMRLWLDTMRTVHRSTWHARITRENRFLASSCPLSTPCTSAGVARRSWSTSLRCSACPTVVGSPVDMELCHQAPSLADIQILGSLYTWAGPSTRAVWLRAKCTPVTEAFTLHSLALRFHSRITRCWLNKSLRMLAKGDFTQYKLTCYRLPCTFKAVHEIRIRYN